MEKEDEMEVEKVAEACQEEQAETEEKQTDGDEGADAAWEDSGGAVDVEEPKPSGDCSAGGDEPGDVPGVEALVAEAEQRGYLRGRNERIEALMAEPGVWEERVDSSPNILSRPRRSVWD